MYLDVFALSVKDRHILGTGMFAIYYPFVCLLYFPFADKVNCYVTVLIDFGFLNRKHFYQLSHYYLYWCETIYIYILL